MISATAMVRRKYNWTHFKLELKPIKSQYMPDEGSFGRANACIQKKSLKMFNSQFVIVSFGISPTVVEVKARNYAFKEAPFAIKS